MIIVTGGAGFIGSNIVKALNDMGRKDILVVDNLKDGTKFINLVDLDIADYCDKEDFIASIIAGNDLGNGDFRTEARQVFKNLQAVAEAAGGTLGDIVKLNAYLTDLANFAVFNEVMAEFIQEPFPARAAVGVASLPKGVQVEAEAVLVLNA